MQSDLTRRSLLAGVAGAGTVPLAGCYRAGSGNQSTETPSDGLQLSVQSVVRVGRSAYDVTFRYRNPNGVAIGLSCFPEGTTPAEPVRELPERTGTVSVRWLPGGDAEQLVWAVAPRNGEVRRAVTAPHRAVRDRWTMTLSELHERFEQADPSGLTVRTGADSQRTMYLRGGAENARFRIWQSGLVSYVTDEGWWAVDVNPDELIPPTGVRDGDDDGEDAPANNQYTFTVANSPYDGSQWMSTLLREGRHWGVNVFYFFPNHTEATPGLDAEQPDEVYSRVSFRLSENWEQRARDASCKLYWAGANFSAGPAGKGGVPPTGDDGWSVRVYTRGLESDDSVAIGSYVYHLDQEGDYGDLWEWPDEVTIGQWTQIDTYVRLNSVSDGSAEDDGLLRTYLNGTLQDERDGLRWRTTEELGFDRLGPGSYWGGEDVSPTNNFVYYDDFRFSADAGEFEGPS